MNPIITRNIRYLAYVSLFMDMASEMLYPVMPVYLKEIGFSVLAIGVLEGIADAVAGLSKGFFGQWSDKAGRRLPFVSAGYFLSALCKPLLVLFQSAWWVLLVRSSDRMGKGMRTAPRDALLADECLPENRATVFGYHRSMDTIGAVIGPLIALVYLWFYPNSYLWLFVFAAVPGFLSVVLTRFIKEKTHSKPEYKAGKPGLFQFFSYYKTATASYQKVVLVLLVFALINSSDILLLLRMKEAGYHDTQVIGMYIFYNLIFAIFSYPLGKIADKIGAGNLLALGMLVFAIVYFFTAFASQFWVFIALFFLYGIFAAGTEGVGKALLSKLCPASETGTAIGSFTALQSICAMFASSLTGAIWWKFGHVYAFVLSAAVAVICSVWLLSVVRKNKLSFQ